MRTADDVLASIDGALRDYETSPDAMRWTPEEAEREGESINTARLLAAAVGLGQAVALVVHQRLPFLRRLTSNAGHSSTVRNRTRT